MYYTSDLNLKNEIMEATSFEAFKKRIRDSIVWDEENPKYATEIEGAKTMHYTEDEWLQGIALLADAHKLNMVSSAFEKYTTDKAKLATCMEILNGLENLCSIEDEQKADWINNMELALWEQDITSLNLARQIMTDMTKGKEGATIGFQVKKQKAEVYVGEELYFKLTTPYNEIKIELSFDVEIQDYPTTLMNDVGVWSDIQLNECELLWELNDGKSEQGYSAMQKGYISLLQGYLNAFPFNEQVLLQERITAFSEAIKEQLAKEICSLYLAHEKNVLSDEDKQRMIELLFTIAVVNRFQKYFYRLQLSL